MIQITVGKIDGVAGAPNPIMLAFGKNVPFSCFVRNEINGLRQMNEVVFSVNKDGSKGVPCMPRTFPVGTWSLGMPGVRSDPLLAPYFIPTTAWQMLDEWEVTNKDGKLWYLKKTGRQVADYAYGLHCSTAHESNGCIHIIDDPSGQHSKFDYLDEIVHSLIDWLRDPTMGQPPEIQVT
jgi:hypothetical protein